MGYSERYGVAQEELIDKINTSNSHPVIIDLQFGHRNVVYLEQKANSKNYCNFKNGEGRDKTCPAKVMGICGGMVKGQALLFDAQNVDIYDIKDITIDMGAYMLCNPAINHFGRLTPIYTRNPKKALLNSDY